MKIVKSSYGSTVCAAVPLFILCMLLPVLLGSVYGLSRGTRGLRIGSQKFQTCPLPHLENGRVTIRSRNRGATFKCDKKYQRFGQKFSTCVRGHWTSPPPVCIKPGCLAVSTIPNGAVLQNARYRYAVLNFTCDPGYSMKGSPVIVCDGKTWNSTEPYCEADPEASSVWCDFETEDMCGWTQEKSPPHSVLWFRQNGSTPSRRVGTGPLYDHTLGQGNDGSYLYIETSVPRRVNHVARMFSPVYGAKLSEDACFTFWYHMYGLNTGSLNVYVKPQGVKLDTVKPVFQKSGEQGDVWLEGFFNISKYEVPFQIVIEGVRGEGFQGDIAFDDVGLDNGSACNRYLSLTTIQPSTFLPSTLKDDTIKNPQSCYGRCGESLDLIDMKTTTAVSHTTIKVPELIMCDCHVGCADNNTCCSDFHIYCIRALNYSMPPMRNTTPFLYKYSTKTEPSIAHAASSNHTISIWNNTTSFFSTKSVSLRPVSIPWHDVTPTKFQLATDVHELHEPAIYSTSIQTQRVVTSMSSAPSNMHVSLQTLGSTRTTHFTALVPSRATRRAITTVTKNDLRPTTHLITRSIPRSTTRSTSRPTTRPTTRPTPRPTTRLTTRPTTHSTLHSTIRPTTRQTTRTTVRPPVRLTTPTKPHRLPLTLTTRTTTTSTTTRRPAIKWTVQPTKKKAISTRVGVTSTTATPGSTITEGWLEPRVSAKIRSEKSSLPLAVGGTVVAILACICAAALVFVVVRRRRRRRHRNHLSDDSDVRFLTADEILDFTLATPKEYRDEDA